MFPRVRTVLVLSMVAMLVLVTSLAGCLSDEDDDDNGNGKEDPVLANAGDDGFGEVGDVITLNASVSSGPIQKYTWTIRGPNATSYDNITKVGLSVDHTFTQAGVYTVTLLVEGKKEDNNSTDTMRVLIDLMETHTGQLQNIQTVNKTYEYTVYPEVQSIKLKLTYPSTVGVPPLAVPMNLDMDVYTDGQTPYATTATQPPDADDTQVEVLDLQIQGVITNGGFTIVVRWGPLATPLTVDFTLEVEIHYRAV